MMSARSQDVPYARDGMALRFWGVRGSLPTPGPDTVRYGGQTSCVELRCGPHLLILDAGSGLRGLGHALAAGVEPVDADLLLSHTHLDHICGLPFFAPMFDLRARLRLWAGHLSMPQTLEQALQLSWQAPLMPDLRRAFRAALTFSQFQAGDILQPHPGLRVTTLPLSHPGMATGYRVEWQGASLCYITDCEHEPAHPGGTDLKLRAFVQDADIMIYDASYTEAEYQARIGWGHSTWQQAVRLADAASVRTAVLFHHDPEHDDLAMDAIAAAASAARPGTLVAREGLRLLVE
jgi:phosphoribosyl 1,2-cyclic phosphodiesterase